MGLTTVRSASDRFALDGSNALVATMQQWLGLSPFAAQEKLAS
jgi:hypothetical protein